MFSPEYVSQSKAKLPIRANIPLEAETPCGGYAFEYHEFFSVKAFWQSKTITTVYL